MGERRDFDEEDGPCPLLAGLLVPEEISRKRLDDERDKIAQLIQRSNDWIAGKGQSIAHREPDAATDNPPNHCDARLNYEAGQINRDGRNLREVCLKAHAIRSVAANLNHRERAGVTGGGRLDHAFYAYPRYPNHGARGEDRCPHGRAESTKTNSMTGWLAPLILL